ncbi:MAG: hypothetical protein ACXVFQ_19040 [Solirubrobacteraceae bacterium]
MTTVNTPAAPQNPGWAAALHRRVLTATTIAVVLVAGSATAAVSDESASPLPALRPHTPSGFTARSSRPNRADWEKIESAARLRRTALARHRTARFRAFVASLGLRELVSIHPLAPGRCATAVTYLYNNLLDLENAYPGEKWNPLRRAVAKEPSLHTCAPRPSTRHHP